MQEQALSRPPDYKKSSGFTAGEGLGEGKEITHSIPSKTRMASKTFYVSKNTESFQNLYASS
ncbi:MAG: hypothetical protein ACYCQI_09265 [Gammaproteobacteria bacterium]